MLTNGPVDTLHAIVVPETFEVTASGAVAGQIWITAGQVAFPEEGWFDFPVVILAWWLDRCASSSGREELRFMEGPFVVNVELRGPASHASFRPPRSAPHEAAFDQMQFVESLQTAAHMVLARCEELSIETREVDQLRARQRD